MPFLSCHMQKIKRPAVVGLSNHIKRDKVSKTNPDIDYKKSVKNYDLIEDKNFLKAIDGVVANATNKERIKKDAVVLSAFVIGCGSKDNHLDEEQQKLFFQDCVDWFGNRYGKDKLVYAKVHQDELGAGHLHLGLVPITKDGRLCCKELFNPKEMQLIQDKLYKDVGSKYSLERGEKGREVKHLKELEYKTFQEENKLMSLRRDVKLLESQNNISKNIRTVDSATLLYVKKFSPKVYENALKNTTNEIVLRNDKELARAFDQSTTAKLIQKTVCNNSPEQYSAYINSSKIWAEKEKERKEAEKEQLENEEENQRERDRDD